MYSGFRSPGIHRFQQPMVCMPNLALSIWYHGSMFIIIIIIIPLVVEVYGSWGCEAQECFSKLSKRLPMQVGVGETEALSQTYCLLAVTLMRQNARAILLRCVRTPLHDYNY